MAKSFEATLTAFLSERDIEAIRVEERTFPGERWFLVFVPEASLPLAQSLAGQLETALATVAPVSSEEALVVTFRPEAGSDASVRADASGRLFAPNVDQLVQLLEARSRTSDALPSLKYVADPRASLSAVRASRHHLIFGRRGVGKTALLLETKSWAVKQGHAAAWINAHVLRTLEPANAAATIAHSMIDSTLQALGRSSSERVKTLAGLSSDLKALSRGKLTKDVLGNRSPELNSALRAVLREDLVRLYVFLDDFYLVPLEHQPYILDFLAGALRDSNGWLKVASIERLSRPYEPSTRLGLEVPHDASRVDLDITLEDPFAAQRFLESVLQNYLEAAGIKAASRVAKREALGRLVLASGGVPRDYLNLFAGSIVVAREGRADSQAIGKEDVAVAAGRASRSKKRDLEQDVTSSMSPVLLSALEQLVSGVRGKGYTYFRVDASSAGTQGYEVLSQLVDLRFVHAVQQGLSDQHQAGVKYEAYVLDLSEYTDIRLKRNLHILDLEEGRWTWRLTGNARTKRPLSGTQFRDRLRDSPLVDVTTLAP